MEIKHARRLPQVFACALLLLALGGCGDDSQGESETGAECRLAIVTDIDETLTLSNDEWEKQKADGTYDPKARESAVELVQAYADRGYFVLYLTARSQTWVLSGTGETSTDATERWLVEHGFPMDPARSRLVLSEKLVPGDAARVYKAEALAALQGEGYTFDYAYGNATTDIGAFADAMIPKAATFIIGVHAGEEGTVAIDGESWSAHLAAHLPTVATACGPS